MSAKNNIIEFPVKNRQIDNHHPHTIHRGDAKMSATDECKEDMKPVIKIILLNYDASMQDTYSQKFMSPLIEGLLKRMRLAQAE